jgi:N-methylhydantoinase B
MGIVARKTLNKGDVVKMFTCTGGDYGDPLERDPQQVALDVKNGFVSVEQAEKDYGVIVDPNTHEVTGFRGGRR